MGQRILVTGGAGYIGSILTPMLLEAGHEVTIVDNFMYRENSLAHVCHHPKFHAVNGDIRNTALMKEQLKKVDVVLPLAAIVGAPACDRDPVAAASINRDAPVELFKLMSTAQCVLMPTTNSGYGTGAAGTTLTEESPLKPLSLYAKHKVEVEEALMARENSVSFRLATVFGMSPRMRLDLLVNDFTYRAVNDRFVVLFEGNFRRNYIHVRDVANAFLFGIESWSKVRSQVFNVGLSEANLSKKELCQRIQRHVKEFVFLEAPVGEDPDKRDYLVSNEKIERAGFRPRHSLDAGLEELIKGYRMLRDSRYRNV